MQQTSACSSSSTWFRPHCLAAPTLHLACLPLHPSIYQGKAEVATAHLKAPNRGPQTVALGQARRVYHFWVAGAHAGALLQPGNNEERSSVLRLQLLCSSLDSDPCRQAVDMLATSGCGTCQQCSVCLPHCGQEQATAKLWSAWNRASGFVPVQSWLCKGGLLHSGQAQSCSRAGQCQDKSGGLPGLFTAVQQSLAAALSSNALLIAASKCRQAY